MEIFARAKTLGSQSPEDLPILNMEMSSSWGSTEDGPQSPLLTKTADIHFFPWGKIFALSQPGTVSFKPLFLALYAQSFRTMEKVRKGGGLQTASSLGPAAREH